MRALLVVNPKATTTSERSRDILVRALRSGVDLQVEYTRRRGHATTLARDAARDGVDLLVTLGGDGTINEVVNGLMTTESAGVDPAGRADRRPALAVVPGGSTNVFAGALGLPRDWAEGTYVILKALQDGTTRTIGLGRADDRYFTFCAGLGFDAAIVRRVEQARLRGRVSTPWLYIRQGLAQLATETSHRDPSITLELPGEPDEIALASAVVQNTSPWTYVGGRAVDACPDASFDLGLDVMGMRKLPVSGTAKLTAQMLGGRPAITGKQVYSLHDTKGFVLRASRPMAFQLDGDYLGERAKVEFTSVPEALRVVC